MPAKFKDPEGAIRQVIRIGDIQRTMYNVVVEYTTNGREWERVDSRWATLDGALEAIDRLPKSREPNIVQGIRIIFPDLPRPAGTSDESRQSAA